MTKEIERLKRKANQEWEMAGLAIKDGDYIDANIHTRKAVEYDTQLKDYAGLTGHREA